MNKYECSDGEKVSESTIKKRLSEAYRRWYSGGLPMCAGCGIRRAIESSHIISKTRCKSIHKTDLIWARENVFPSCRQCHVVFETTNNYEWCSLLNVDQCLEVFKKHDEESYQKRIQIFEQRFRDMETNKRF